MAKATGGSHVAVACSHLSSLWSSMVLVQDEQRSTRRRHRIPEPISHPINQSGADLKVLWRLLDLLMKSQRYNLIYSFSQEYQLD